MLIRITLLLTALGCIDKSRLYSDNGSGGDDTTSSDTGSGTGSDSGSPSSDDADGDGYASEDCDDSNAEVHPGATEICDGVDNDCDESTTEAGMVLWIASDGSTEDLSDSFSAGEESEPTVWMGSAEGELHVCDGSYFAQLVIVESVSVSGHAGESSPTLSSGQSASVVTIDGQGLDVSLDTLKITGGAGSFDSRLDTRLISSGGGIACAGPNTLQLSQVNIEGNDAAQGGGIYLEECTLEAEEISISANNATSAGGGIMVFNAAATLQDSAIEANRSDDAAGGLHLVSDGAVSTEVVLRDTRVSGNRGTTGGAEIYGSALACEGSTKTSGGFLSNVASSSSGTGGVLMVGPSSLVSEACDWGPKGTAGDNEPEDISSTDTNFGDDESFVCNSKACN